MGKVATEATLQNGIDLLGVIASNTTDVFGGPGEIKSICAKGLAPYVFKIGDIIYIPWTDKSEETPVTYNVPTVVTHFGDAVDENGVTHKNAMYLMWMYATPKAVQFDHPEAIAATESTFDEHFHYYTKPGDDYVEQTVTYGEAIPSGTTYYKHVRSGMAGRLRYGSDDWEESAYRQWLNSGADKNAWWVATHESDVAPNELATLPGFLSGFTEDWLSIFQPVKVQTAKNTVSDGGVTAVTYDRFFLPSLEQMYGSPQASGIEGEYWEYWKNVTGLATPTNGSSSNTNKARMIPTIANPTGAAVYCRLRSAFRSGTNGVWSVFTAGSLYYRLADYGYRSQPACVIY